MKIIGVKNILFLFLCAAISLQGQDSVPVKKRVSFHKGITIRANHTFVFGNTRGANPSGNELFGLRTGADIRFMAGLQFNHWLEVMSRPGVFMSRFVIWKDANQLPQLPNPTYRTITEIDFILPAVVRFYHTNEELFFEAGGAITFGLYQSSRTYNDPTNAWSSFSIVGSNTGIPNVIPCLGFGFRKRGIWEISATGHLSVGQYRAS